MKDAKLTQPERFKEAARQIEADESEANWEARLKAIARQKPKDEPVEPE